MTLLDRFGRPVPSAELRLSMGFVPQLLAADEGDVITGVAPPQPASGYFEESVDDAPRCHSGRAEGG